MPDATIIEEPVVETPVEPVVETPAAPETLYQETPASDGTVVEPTGETEEEAPAPFTLKERPETFPEKYWVEGNMEASLEKFMKGHGELEKAYSGKVPGAPDEYEVDIPEGVEIPDEVFTQFKEQGLTNDQVKTVMDTYLKFGGLDAVVEARIDLETEKLKTKWNSVSDDSFKQRLRQVSAYAMEKMGGDESIVRKLMVDAPGVLALENLMRADAARGRVFEGHESSASVVTEDMIDKVVASDAYQNNEESAHKELEKLINKFEAQKEAARNTQRYV